MFFIGDNAGVARQIQNGYIGVNGVAKKITNGFIGVNGVAKNFFGSDSPYPIPLTPYQIELLRGAYNLENQTILTKEQLKWYDKFRSDGLEYGVAYSNQSKTFICGSSEQKHAIVSDENTTNKYFINSTTFDVYLLDGIDNDISDTNFQSNIEIWRTNPNIRLTMNTSLTEKLLNYTQNGGIIGSFTQTKNWYWNTYEHNLDNCLFLLWGSKNIPIYIGDSVANAKLLPDPSSL